MTTVIVEHEWKKGDTDSVFKVVGSIVDMAKGGKLPQGFSLTSIDVIPDTSKAMCRWEAPSAEALSGLISQVNPPTVHRIKETQRIL